MKLKKKMMQVDEMTFLHTIATFFFPLPIEFANKQAGIRYSVHVGVLVSMLIGKVEAGVSVDNFLLISMHVHSYTGF